MHGAQFTLVIPADEAAYADDTKVKRSVEQQEVFPLPESKDPVSVIEDEKQTVMVIDDDTEIALYLKTLLSPYYKVICRFDADSAIKTMKENAPDCILCDVVMPGKDGYTLCSEVREDMQLCHLPIILVTANAAMQNQVKGLNVGANAYVTKPFDPDYLLAADPESGKCPQDSFFFHQDGKHGGECAFSSGQEVHDRALRADGE